MRIVDSPNCDQRPDGVAVTLVVLHSISLPPGEYGGDAIERFFTNCLDPAAHPYFAQICSWKVSAHYLVRRNGEVIQFVAPGKRSWHAGVSSWRGRERCNDFSIGIELEGTDQGPFEDAQYQALERLLGELRRQFPLRDIAAHSDVAPGRKSDPGPRFDWPRLLAALAR
jgi:AmpD protein